MNSGVQMAAVDPLALFLGLGGRTMPSAPGGMPGFGELLNMAPLPTAPTSAGGEPSTIVTTLGMESGPQPDDMIPIMIPGEMLSLLGQAAMLLPDSVATDDRQQMPQGPVMARADVLAPDDGDGDMIYVRIQTPGNSDTLMPESSDDNGDRQEMILPMRLRTVEHRDGRIIAAGVMQTAAGKDVPIRLHMQAAENVLPEQRQEFSGIHTSTPVAAGKADGGTPAMSRMLADMNAEMIVIEPATAETMPMPRMPFADIMGRTERIARYDAIVQSPNAVDPATISVKPVAAQATNPVMQQAPTATTMSDMLSVASSDTPAADEDTPDMIDLIGGRETSSSTAAKADGGTMPGTTTFTAVSDTGTVVEPSQQSSDVTQVRFYDIDHKLEQVKQNPGQRIKIQLVPSNLGRMELSIVSHRGMVTVNLAVESTQAKQAVERNLPQLEQRLALSGIKVDSVQLQVNHPTRSTIFANAHQQQYQGAYGGHGGRGSQQSPYRSSRQYRMATPDAGFKQELVNCLA